MTVEFLPGDVEPPDEPPPATRRPWRWIAAGAVLCVAGLVWSLTRPSVGPASSQPQPHPTARAHHRAPRPVPECRHVPDCSVNTRVPAQVARLARDYLPAGTRLRVRTVVAVDSLTHRDLLVARDVVAGLGSVQVQIRVQRGGPATQEIVPDPPGVGSLLLHRVNSGFVVRLQYLAPDDVPPMLSRLRALIGDPRLAAA